MAQLVEGIDYDLLVNWQRRLGREEPFFRKLFREHGTRSVLDCGCGTGRHADMFARLGLQVVGADVSQKAIELARKNFERPGVQFVVCDFLSVDVAFGGRGFDAVVSLGNSLPNLPDRPSVEQAVGTMASVLAPGGIMVLHLLNFPKWVRERRRFEEPRSGADPARDMVFVKMFDYFPEKVRVLILQVEKTGAGWAIKWDEGDLTPVTADELVAMCRGASLGGVELYQDHDFSPFDERCSDNLVLVAKKAAKS